MTTDTVDKQVHVAGEGWSVGGMAKGAGMLAPALATMLVVLTTDAEVTAGDCDRALRAATRVTFDRLDSDGCQSTNDTVLLMASGASGVRPDPAAFDDAVRAACHDLAQQAGARRRGRRPRHRHRGAARRHRGRRGRGGPLDRAQQPVQGRGLRPRPQLGPHPGRRGHDVRRVRAAHPRRRGERRADLRRRRAGASRDLVDLEPRAVQVTVDLHAGDATATVWTNDLTHAYVHENSAYST
ncbi:hypothetical protein GCM10025868_06200 [Angustibacter aerolatus]|uniref:Glutamate N-acetyltransferase n=1 Tax=Angustibacter aerolatus TaxID=1162965 RepID=A0ABQ6JDU7_9ACTN|nr:hypothetical protein GCM10025868_06200 [Angustibacter aerolatus]